MKKTLLFGIVATIVAFTSSTARAGDVGVRVQIGLPFPRILLPPRAIVFAPPVVHYPAPRPVYCAPPVVYHQYDHRYYHGRVHYRWDRRHDRHHHSHGQGHRGY